jgi:hypothetical protein
MPQNRTRVLVVCPDCGLVYRQWVTGTYIGPRKRCTAAHPEIRLVAEEAGQGKGKGAWYGLMRCTQCSIRLAPPALRERLEKWLLHGEEI